MAVRPAARGLSFELCNVLPGEARKRGRSVQSVSMCVRIVSEPCQAMSGRVRLESARGDRVRIVSGPCQAVSGRVRDICVRPCQDRVRAVSDRVRPCQARPFRKHSRTPATETSSLTLRRWPPQHPRPEPPKIWLLPRPFPQLSPFTRQKRPPKQLQPRR